jgi:oligoendopeptidase F
MDFTTDALLKGKSRYPKNHALPRHTAEGQKLALMATDAHNISSKQDMGARKSAHLKLAEEHRKVANAFAKTNPRYAEMNNHAADLHEHAALENSKTDGLNARGATQAAADASQSANAMVMNDSTPVTGVTTGDSVANA